MTIIEHPLFGAVDLGTTGTWEATLEFAGREVDVDMTLDEPSSAPADIQERLSLLDTLSLLDRVARVAIAGESRDGEVTASALYMAHHRQELSREEWTQVFGGIDPTSIDVETFLAHLHLVRVGLYPADEDRCLLLDYTLGKEVTDYLLSVSFDRDGQFAAIDMES